MTGVQTCALPIYREATQYINYNYTINQFLGELEYRLRKGDISKEEFKSKCEEIYEKYGINFDTLRENLSLFEQSDIYHKQIKEFIDNNYYKLNYDENGNRTEKTELDIKSEALDTKISNRLKTQFQEYCKQKQNDEKTKEEHIQETNGRQ